jgi:hypothetical protein
MENEIRGELITKYVDILFEKMKDIENQFLKSEDDNLSVAEQCCVLMNLMANKSAKIILVMARSTDKRHTEILDVMTSAIKRALIENLSLVDCDLNTKDSVSQFTRDKH